MFWQCQTTVSPEVPRRGRSWLGRAVMKKFARPEYRRGVVSARIGRPYVSPPAVLLYGWDSNGASKISPGIGDLWDVHQIVQHAKVYAGESSGGLGAKERMAVSEGQVKSPSLCNRAD